MQLDEGIWQKDAAERERVFEQECERALMESLSLLTKVQDLLPQVSLHTTHASCAIN